MGRIVAVVVLAAALVGGAAGYGLGAGGWSLAPRSAAAQDECFTFAETGKMVCGVFLIYWRENGGLAQQGLPLTEAFEERSDVDGQLYTVQYFERARFEHHPANPPPYHVQLGLLGRERYLARYGGGHPGAAPLAVGQTVTFPGANVRGVLRGTVTDVKDNVALQFRGRPITPTGRFVAVFMRVTNVGLESTQAGRSSLRVQDGRGRLFDMADLDAQLGAYEVFGRNIVYTTIQPSASDDEVFVFDIAADSTDLLLVPGPR